MANTNAENPRDKACNGRDERGVISEGEHSSPILSKRKGRKNSRVRNRAMGIFRVGGKKPKATPELIAWGVFAGEERARSD